MCSVALSRPTLFHPMDSSPPVSSFHGIVQSRILEWISIPPQEASQAQGLNPCLKVSPALQMDSFHWATGEAAYIGITFPKIFLRTNKFTDAKRIINLQNSLLNKMLKSACESLCFSSLLSFQSNHVHVKVNDETTFKFSETCFPPLKSTFYLLRSEWLWHWILYCFF